MPTASWRTKSGNQLQCTAIETVEEYSAGLVESDVREPMANPVLRPGYAGAMNRHGYAMQDEPREKALVTPSISVCTRDRRFSWPMHQPVEQSTSKASDYTMSNGLPQVLQPLVHTHTYTRLDHL